MHQKLLCLRLKGQQPRRFALVMVAFVVDVAFCLSVGGVLGMHARMVAVNCTTIEMFEKRRAADWPYDRGARRNLEEVFGTRCVRAPACHRPVPAWPPLHVHGRRCARRARHITLP